MLCAISRSTVRSVSCTWGSWKFLSKKTTLSPRGHVGWLDKIWGNEGAQVEEKGSVYENCEPVAAVPVRAL